MEWLDADRPYLSLLSLYSGCLAHPVVSFAPRARRFEEEIAASYRASQRHHFSDWTVPERIPLFPCGHMAGGWSIATYRDRVLGGRGHHALRENTWHHDMDRRPPDWLLGCHEVHPRAGTRHAGHRHAAARSQCQPIVVSRQTLSARLDV